MHIAEVYVARVSMLNSSLITKTVLRMPVVKMTSKYVVVSDYGQQLKFEHGKCFLNREDAEAEADSLANELIADLVRRVQELKQPASYLDRVLTNDEE